MKKNHQQLNLLIQIIQSNNYNLFKKIRMINLKKDLTIMKKKSKIFNHYKI